MASQLVVDVRTIKAQKRNILCRLGVAALGLASMVGCAHSPAPTPALPPPPTVFPITIAPSMVGQRVMVQLGIAPPTFYVTCCLPKGMKVEAVNGKLWLDGIPLQAGEFRFRVTTTPPPVGTTIR
ncbi:MAG: hypothetical protein JWQ87_5443 [Candidatus Sulfotelmatobacter sp.]|nr:hypothetical protein [Candidatus Sulfotelmatobacter sp.]